MIALPAAIPPLSRPHPLSKAAAELAARASSSSNSIVITSFGTNTSTTTSSPPGSPTGRLILRSPILGPMRERRLTAEEQSEIEDGECAFPTSEHESRYEAADDEDGVAGASDNDDDVVYADFSVIFGGGGPGSSDGADSDEEGYDDYMDDLDGIPYTVR